MASKASSIQPRAAARSVRRCAEVIWLRGEARLVAIARIVNGQREIGNRKDVRGCRFEARGLLRATKKAVPMLLSASGSSVEPCARHARSARGERPRRET